jgi:hypothetical protein
MKTHRNSCSVILAFWITLGGVEGNAVDVKNYLIGKARSWEQAYEGDIKTADADPYLFQAEVMETTLGSVLGATVIGPTGKPYALSRDEAKPDQWRYSWSPVNDEDIGLPAFNALFPDGTYTLSITTVHDGTKMLPMIVTGPLPNAPIIENFGEAQAIDPKTSFTLRWGPFLGGTSGDEVSCNLGNLYKTSGNGGMRSAVIPANTLPENNSIWGDLVFWRLVTNTTAYPGALGIICYGQWLNFEVRTIETQDRTAPVVRIITPSNGGSYNTTQATVALEGTASDNVGVSQVSWRSDRGREGTAAGTTNWSIYNITLQAGTNNITVTAQDAAGNEGIQKLTVVANLTDGDFGITKNSDGSITITNYHGMAKDVVVPGQIAGAVVKRIGNGAFAQRRDLRSITLAATVETIGIQAFLGCTGLNKFTVADGVTVIEAQAFGGCSELEQIALGARVARIDDSAFSQCRTLQKIWIPGGVTNIGIRVFYDCDALTSIDVDPVNKHYSSVDGVLVSGDRTELIAYGAGRLGDYQVPDEIKQIGPSAFSYCTGLTGVKIPDTVETIGAYAFDSTGLAEVTVPERVIRIEGGTFSWCKHLTKVVLPEGVEEIGDSAFGSCTVLQRMRMPKTLKLLGTRALNGCDNLHEVYFRGGPPETGTDPLVNTEATIYYKAGTPGWQTHWGGRPTQAWNAEAQIRGLIGATLEIEVRGSGPLAAIASCNELGAGKWRVVQEVQLGNGSTRIILPGQSARASFYITEMPE